MIEIPDIWGEQVLYSSEAPSLRLAAEEAVAKGISLRCAELSRADLSVAALRNGQLAGARCWRASLAWASCEGANLFDVDFTGADLTGIRLEGAILGGMHSAQSLTTANLSSADFKGAFLDGEILVRAPLTLAGLLWPVVISDAFMRIGCQRHSHADWASMPAAGIRGMHRNAPKFWKEWQKPLLQMCEAHSRPVRYI